ncbi:MAG: erythromycin esterase family protein [Hyphomicrobiaceae bacterium]
MRRILPIALLVLLAPLSAHLYADDLAAARSAIEAQYTRLDSAVTRKDPSPFADIAAPDLQITSATGDTLDLAGATKAWREVAASLDTVTSRSKVQSAVAEGAAVRVVAHIVQEGMLKQMGSAVSFRGESTAHDTWVRAGAAWHLSRSVEVRSRIWLGGNLVQETTASPPLTTAQREAIVAELRARLIPFETVASGSGFDDLAALDAIVGDARIVALGEATHGTAEFFRMKHRIFEYLVERKGFSVFAFETNWPDVETVDRYVRTGEGTAASAMKGIFGVWQTREVLDLIEWMRAYNSRPGRTRLLSFTAFDMQGPETAAKCVIEAVSRLGDTDGETMRRAYDGIGGMYERMDPLFSANPLSDAEKAAFRAKATAGLKLLEDRRDALLRLLTPAEYRRAHRCATIVVQASAPGAEDVGAARDAAMAENIKWLAEEAYPGERIAIWAHNGHVAAASDAKGSALMGRHLREIFGQQMRVLGFALDRGEVSALKLKQGKTISKGRVVLPIPAAKADSPEALLRAAGIPRAILDLRTVPATGALGARLAEVQPTRSIGWGFDPEAASAYYQGFVLPQAFDALIFFAETTAVSPLQ